MLSVFQAIPSLGSDDSVTKAILGSEKQRQPTVEATGDIIHDEMRNIASKSVHQYEGTPVIHA